MLTVTQRLSASACPDPGAQTPRLRLDWDQRSKSRFAATTGDGREFAVFLPRGSVLRDGDVLVASDGTRILVEAAAQPLLRVRADNALQLLRAAYHLGNRHVPLQVEHDHLQLEPDPVLEQMLRRMGCSVDAVEAGFEPEAGAYGGEDGQHHGGHAHDHAHDSAHGHGSADGGHGHDHR